MTFGLHVDAKRLGRTDLQPVALDERVDLVDVERGFALYGVLLANLVWITTDVVLTDARLAQLPTAPLDRVVKPLVVLLVDHKFYTLFSFLFGLGFAIQRDVHREMELLVQCGLTPAQALAAATRNPAEWLQAKELGTIAAGRLADLIMLQADPLVDIRNTQRIELVIQGGRVWTPKQLLAEANRQAAAR